MARLCWKCFEHVCIYSVFKIIELPSPLTIKYAGQWCQDFLGLVSCQKFLMCHRWLHGTPMNEPIPREASWSDPIPQARVEVRAIAAKQNKVFSIQPQLDLASVMFVSLQTKRRGNIQQHFFWAMEWGIFASRLWWYPSFGTTSVRILSSFSPGLKGLMGEPGQGNTWVRLERIRSFGGTFVET